MPREINLGSLELSEGALKVLYVSLQYVVSKLTEEEGVPESDISFREKAVVNEDGSLVISITSENVPEVCQITMRVAAGGGWKYRR